MNNGKDLKDISYKRYFVKHAIAYYVEVANHIKFLKYDFNIQIVENILRYKLHKYRDEKEDWILTQNDLKHLSRCEFGWKMTPMQVVRFGIIVFHNLVKDNIEINEKNIIDDLNCRMKLFSTYTAVEEVKRIKKLNGQTVNI